MPLLPGSVSLKAQQDLKTAMVRCGKAPSLLHKPEFIGARACPCILMLEGHSQGIPPLS